ncbi:MAG: hypothetical protein R3C01_18625 [Planctomycetaceae bacterium]
MSSPFLQRLDDFAERWGDRFHPIVVREVRQALKSSGFTISFMLLLLACWISSIALMITGGESTNLAVLGEEFFAYYFFPLNIALCFVIPSILFQNVVAEFDGQTFEMLAITTLSARSIVFGKLKSASIQMGAFFSAVAPFLCFTVLLEGVSVLGIAMALVVAYLAGLSSCMGAMMLGSLGKQSGWRIVCLLFSLINGLFMCSVAQGLGTMLSREATSNIFLGGICGGAACFSYGFLFYSLLTVGVSVAQFSPTLPKSTGHRSSALTKENQRNRSKSSNQKRAPAPPIDTPTLLSTDTTPPSSPPDPTP